MSNFKNYKRSIIFECEYTQLKDATQDINKQMALLNAEFRRSSEDVKANGTALDHLTLVHEKLSVQIELQKDKVNELKNYLKELNEAEGDNSKSIVNTTIELKKAEATLIKYQSDLEQTKEKIDGFNVSTAEMSDKLELLDAEFKLQQVSVEQTADKLKALIEQQNYYNDKAKLQKTVVEQLKSELDELTKSEGLNEKAIVQKTTQLKRAETELINIRKDIDNVTKELKEQDTKLGVLSRKWETFEKILSESGLNIESVASSIQKIGAAMAGIGVVSATMSMSFDQEFSKVKTIADETQISFDDLKKGVLDVSSTINVDAKVAANALYEIVSANISTADSLKVLEGSAKLAKTGFTDINTAADLMTTVLNAYGSSVEEVNKYSDQMILTQKLAKTTIGELGSSFGDVAGFAATANVEFAQIGSALSVLTTRGVGTSESITALKAILSAVISPTKEAKDMADELGISFNLSSLQSRGFVKFLRDIEKGCRGDTEAMASLFGSSEALNAVLQLTSKEGMAQFSENLEIISGASGTTEEALRALESPGEDLSEAFNRLKNTLIESGSAFEPIINMVTGFISIIGQAPPTIVTTIAVLGTLALTIGTVIKTVNETMSTVNSVSSIVNKVSGGLSPLEMKIIKVGAAILGVVAALTALLAIWGVLSGKGGEIQNTMNGIANNIGSMNSSIGNMRLSANSATKGGYAIGTEFVKEDGYYDVGEHGKERVFLRRGAKVANDIQTKQMSSNDKNITTYNLNNVTIQTNSANDLFEQIQILARKGLV
ncbi:phage tail tape measure protein [Zhenhengia yiwuensis]|uniref:Phage tail tape measure protein n=1 Tax=Zhenhengia yiwuensis TaxID=2763666 RepID=A0A926EKX5_9FIRM|nr:phage tail tape measure protein [Zhenhengia yiwuensis]MBC8581489.1 phage tail tape measure protein [Zhenhengia yiwuensis]